MSEADKPAGDVENDVKAQKAKELAEAQARFKSVLREGFQLSGSAQQQATLAALKKEGITAEQFLQDARTIAASFPLIGKDKWALEQQINGTLAKWIAGKSERSSAQSIRNILGKLLEDSGIGADLRLEEGEKAAKRYINDLLVREGEKETYFAMRHQGTSQSAPVLPEKLPEYIRKHLAAYNEAEPSIDLSALSMGAQHLLKSGNPKWMAKYAASLETDIALIEKPNKQIEDTLKGMGLDEETQKLILTLAPEYIEKRIPELQTALGIEASKLPDELKALREQNPTEGSKDFQRLQNLEELHFLLVSKDLHPVLTKLNADKGRVEQLKRESQFLTSTADAVAQDMIQKSLALVQGSSLPAVQKKALTKEIETYFENRLLKQDGLGAISSLQSIAKKILQIPGGDQIPFMKEAATTWMLENAAIQKASTLLYEGKHKDYFDHFEKSIKLIPAYQDINVYDFAKMLGGPEARLSDTPVKPENKHQNEDQIKKFKDMGIDAPLLRVEGGLLGGIPEETLRYDPEFLKQSKALFLIEHGKDGENFDQAWQRRRDNGDIGREFSIGGRIGINTSNSRDWNIGEWGMERTHLFQNDLTNMIGTVLAAKEQYGENSPEFKAAGEDARKKLLKPGYAEALAYMVATMDYKEITLKGTGSALKHTITDPITIGSFLVTMGAGAVVARAGTMTGKQLLTAGLQELGRQSAGKLAGEFVERQAVTEVVRASLGQMNTRLVAGRVLNHYGIHGLEAGVWMRMYDAYTQELKMAAGLQSEFEWGTNAQAFLLGAAGGSGLSLGMQKLGSEIGKRWRGTLNGADLIGEQNWIQKAQKFAELGEDDQSLVVMHLFRAGNEGPREKYLGKLTEVERAQFDKVTADIKQRIVQAQDVPSLIKLELDPKFVLEAMQEAADLAAKQGTPLPPLIERLQLLNMAGASYAKAAANEAAEAQLKTLKGPDAEPKPAAASELQAIPSRDPSGQTTPARIELSMGEINGARQAAERAFYDLWDNQLTSEQQSAILRHIQETVTVEDHLGRAQPIEIKTVSEARSYAGTVLSGTDNQGATTNLIAFMQREGIIVPDNVMTRLRVTGDVHPVAVMAEAVDSTITNAQKAFYDAADDEAGKLKVLEGLLSSGNDYQISAARRLAENYFADLPDSARQIEFANSYYLIDPPYERGIRDIIQSGNAEKTLKDVVDGVDKIRFIRGTSDYRANRLLDILDDEGGPGIVTDLVQSLGSKDQIALGRLVLQGWDGKPQSDIRPLQTQILKAIGEEKTTRLGQQYPHLADEIEAALTSAEKLASKIHGPGRASTTTRAASGRDTPVALAGEVDTTTSSRPVAGRGPATRVAGDAADGPRAPAGLEQDIWEVMQTGNAAARAEKLASLADHDLRVRYFREIPDMPQRVEALAELKSRPRIDQTEINRIAKAYHEGLPNDAEKTTFVNGLRSKPSLNATADQVTGALPRDPQELDVSIKTPFKEMAERPKDSGIAPKTPAHGELTYSNTVNISDNYKPAIKKFNRLSEKGQIDILLAIQKTENTDAEKALVKNALDIDLATISPDKRINLSVGLVENFVDSPYNFGIPGLRRGYGAQSLPFSLYLPMEMGNKRANYFLRLLRAGVNLDSMPDLGHLLMLKRGEVNSKAWSDPFSGNVTGPDGETNRGLTPALLLRTSALEDARANFKPHDPSDASVIKGLHNTIAGKVVSDIEELIAKFKKDNAAAIKSKTPTPEQDKAFADKFFEILNTAYKKNQVTLSDINIFVLRVRLGELRVNLLGGIEKIFSDGTGELYRGNPRIWAIVKGASQRTPTEGIHDVISDSIGLQRIGFTWQDITTPAYLWTRLNNNRFGVAGTVLSAPVTIPWSIGKTTADLMFIMPAKSIQQMWKSGHIAGAGLTTVVSGLHLAGSTLGAVNLAYTASGNEDNMPAIFQLGAAHAYALDAGTRATVNSARYGLQLYTVPAGWIVGTAGAPKTGQVIADAVPWAAEQIYSSPSSREVIAGYVKKLQSDVASGTPQEALDAIKEPLANLEETKRALQQAQIYVKIAPHEKDSPPKPLSKEDLKTMAPSLKALLGEDGLKELKDGQLTLNQYNLLAEKLPLLPVPGWMWGTSELRFDDPQVSGKIDQSLNDIEAALSKYKTDSKTAPAYIASVITGPKKGLLEQPVADKDGKVIAASLKVALSKPNPTNDEIEAILKNLQEIATQYRELEAYSNPSAGVRGRSPVEARAKEFSEYADSKITGNLSAGWTSFRDTQLVQMFKERAQIGGLLKKIANGDDVDLKGISVKDKGTGKIRLATENDLDQVIEENELREAKLSEWLGSIYKLNKAMPVAPSNKSPETKQGALNSDASPALVQVAGVGGESDRLLAAAAASGQGKTEPTVAADRLKQRYMVVAQADTGSVSADLSAQDILKQLEEEMGDKAPAPSEKPAAGAAPKSTAPDADAAEPSIKDLARKAREKLKTNFKYSQAEAALAQIDEMLKAGDLINAGNQITLLKGKIANSQHPSIAKLPPVDRQALDSRVSAITNDLESAQKNAAQIFWDDFSRTGAINVALAKNGLPFLGSYLKTALLRKEDYTSYETKLTQIKTAIDGVTDKTAQEELLKHWKPSHVLLGSTPGGKEHDDHQKALKAQATVAKAAEDKRWWDKQESTFLEGAEIFSNPLGGGNGGVDATGQALGFGSVLGRNIQSMWNFWSNKKQAGEGAAKLTNTVFGIGAGLFAYKMLSGTIGTVAAIGVALAVGWFLPQVLTNYHGGNKKGPLGTVFGDAGSATKTAAIPGKKTDVAINDDSVEAATHRLAAAKLGDVAGETGTAKTHAPVHVAGTTITHDERNGNAKDLVFPHKDEAYQIAFAGTGKHGCEDLVRTGLGINMYDSNQCTFMPSNTGTPGPYRIIASNVPQGISLDCTG